MKFLALIPARYASTRFPGKPLADIHGKPMIQHVWERCAPLFDHIYVATDDQRIADAVVAFGGQSILTRDDHRSGTDRAAEALDAACRTTGIEFDVVVNIQGDEPFVSTEQLELLKGCFDEQTTQIATLVKPFGADESIFNENSPKVVLSTTGRALYFSRSPIPFLRGVAPEQWASERTYYKHIGLYGYRAQVLREVTRLAPSPLEIAESLEQLRWLENGYQIQTAVTHHQSFAIDTPEDLAHVLTL